MLDLISPTMNPPISCKFGCEDWSKVVHLWNAKTAPLNAFNNCAQPGGAVDSREYGSWCFCKKANTTLKANSQLDPNHPMDNDTFYFLDADLSKFWSFETTDASEWFRADYEQLDAAPITLHAVPNKPHTYYLFNAYTESNSNQWLSFETSKDDFQYVRSVYSKKDAAPIQFVPNGEKSAQWALKNTYYDNASSYFLGYNATDPNHWLRANINVNSMNVKLIKALPTNLTWAYCTYKDDVPEMINLQIAGRGSVVVSFVTFHNSTTGTETPIVRYVEDDASDTRSTSWTMKQGVVHVHKSPSGERIYHMAFVRLEDLTPRSRVTYQVQSGRDGTWSSNSTFTVPHSGIKDIVQNKPDTIDIYGDMGVYSWNNMQNLYDDCMNNEIGLVIHMGDHAYNEGDEDEKRADGYMSAFQPILKSCPWLPIVGNHEYYSGEELSRYLDSTFENYNDTMDTTESALGGLLATASFYGAAKRNASSSTIPSGTSRFFSVDYGRVHLIATDMNGYYGVDPCGKPCLQAQIDWLTKDLTAANANRKEVPWIVVMSHYPFYCTGCQDNQETTSSEWFASDGAETYGNLNMTKEAKLEFEHARKVCGGSASDNNTNHLLCDAETKSKAKTVKQSSDAAIADLVKPFLQKFGVDVFIAGHWHYYESLWPQEIGTSGSGGKPYQKSFDNPRTTVHVTNGNGGPPSPDNFCEDPSTLPSCTIPSTRKQTSEYSYSRLVVHNATHLDIETYLNKDGSLFDTFTVVQEKHGPFGE